MTERAPLRLGLIGRDRSLSAATAHELLRLEDDGVVDVVAMLRLEERPSTSRIWHVLDVAEDRVSRLRNRYRWADSHLSAFHTPERGVIEKAAEIDHGSPGAVERWRAAEIDVAIRLVPGRFDEFLAACRVGSLAFDHRVSGAVIPGLAEYVADDDFTDVVLRADVHSEQEDRSGHRHVVAGSVVTRSASWNEHRRDVESKSAIMLSDLLRRLAAGSLSTGSTPTSGIDPVQPHTRQTAVGAVNRLVRRTLSNRRGPSEDRLQWRVRFGSTSSVDEFDPATLDELVPPDGKYWADPFAVPVGDSAHQIFFEEFDIAAGRGNISTGRLADGRLQDVAVVMEPDHHLSYPHLVEHDGALFMVPESNELGDVDLWRCTEFPHGWERERTLLADTTAVDSTLLWRDDRWWLFTNLDRVGTGEFGHELHLFSSPDLLTGEFEPHPANPVVSDARCARMAGSFVSTQDGGVLRPAQLGGRSYGSGLRLMRVDELSPTSYRESLAREYLPDWSPEVVGIHHLCVTSGLVVTDACHVAGPSGSAEGATMFERVRSRVRR